MNISITEYADFAKDGNERTVPTGKEPALVRANFSVDASGNSVYGPFNEHTRCVRIKGDANFTFNIGTGTPTAASSDTSVYANVAEFFGIDQAFPGVLKMAAKSV